MNRDQNEKYRERQLRKKYDMVHMLPGLGLPELSGIYLKNFYNSSKRYKVVLPPSIVEADAKFCGSCGCIRIPNYNVHMEITKEGELQFQCKHCSRVTHFQYSIHKKESKDIDIIPKEKFVAKWPNKGENENKITKNGGNNARDRQKKRKSNSLSAMLNKKNDEKKKQSSTSLSLESFMKI